MPTTPQFIVKQIGGTAPPSWFQKQLRVPQAATDILLAFAADVVSRMKQEPGQIVGRPYPWASERQRRYVMAMIREGKIRVPRNRTGRMAQGWITRVFRRQGGGGPWGSSQVVQISNSTPYSAFVIGRQQSYEMRARGWHSLVSVSNQLWPAYRARITAMGK